MQRWVAMHAGSKPVIVMDSIGRAIPSDTGSIIVAASHGGKSSAEIALAVSPAAVFFNDAGRGKEDAGIAGLALLQVKEIAAATVGHESACIGDPADMWACGVITHVNEKAAAYGLSAGQVLRDVAGTLGKIR